MVNQELFFQEEQRFRQWWIWLIVVSIAVMSWWGFIQISGNEGVELILKDDRLVMIGSQNAESFAQAIAEASGLQQEIVQP